MVVVSCIVFRAYCNYTVCIVYRVYRIVCTACSCIFFVLRLDSTRFDARLFSSPLLSSSGWQPRAWKSASLLRWTGKGLTYLLTHSPRVSAWDGRWRVGPRWWAAWATFTTENKVRCTVPGALLRVAVVNLLVFWRGSLVG